VKLLTGFETSGNIVDELVTARSFNGDNLRAASVVFSGFGSSSEVMQGAYFLFEAYMVREIGQWWWIDGVASVRTELCVWVGSRLVWCGVAWPGMKWHGEMGDEEEADVIWRCWVNGGARAEQ